MIKSTSLTELYETVFIELNLLWFVTIKHLVQRDFYFFAQSETPKYMFSTKQTGLKYRQHHYENVSIYLNDILCFFMRQYVEVVFVLKCH